MYTFVKESELKGLRKDYETVLEQNNKLKYENDLFAKKIETKDKNLEKTKSTLTGYKAKLEEFLREE